MLLPTNRIPDLGPLAILVPVAAFWRFGVDLVDMVVPIAATVVVVASVVTDI